MIFRALWCQKWEDCRWSIFNAAQKNRKRDPHYGGLAKQVGICYDFYDGLFVFTGAKEATEDVDSKKNFSKLPELPKNFETTIFESLNTDFAPDVIETVISGERFAGKCLNCGFEAHLEYDMLYHDMKHGAAIWVVHDNGPEYARKVAEVRETELLPYAMTRIVPNMDALREKAACLESGKDDRVVELCKVFLVSQTSQKMPDFEFRNAFYTYCNGKDIVFLYGAAGKEIAYQLSDRVYGAIAERFKQPLAQMVQTPYQMIDYDWAADFFEKLH